jgi:serine/threonine protein kinase
MNRGGTQSLDKYLETRPGNRVSEKEAAVMLKQMAESLSFLHKKGIAHRDIKLGNVLIGDNLKCVLIDFGFAIKCDNTKLSTFCGTPCYMCPEILLKKPYIGQQADTWALGVLLYRLVCGD